ncbi:helix-turn-helix domain-containing protein [Halostella litorea]|uniref:helix-turn-helix domain-containing protein n=1 Tax=Halostella litorea TaxID=2528831 RepID=UPI00192A673B|nr:helix-turn-helix domain-containing protein [Halostella litorea]
MVAQGVHAEVEVAASACRVIDVSREAGTVRAVSRCASPADDPVTVEFSADASAEFDDVEEVFNCGDEAVYRFDCERGSTSDCACELVESRGCPVRHLQVEDGVIVLSFVAGDVADLRETVADLRERFDEISLRRLTRSNRPEAGDDLTLLDHARLTERQREVLETAHGMGYFDHPKEANATEVSDTLGINRSTFSEHLSAAQSKLLDSLLEA